MPKEINKRIKSFLHRFGLHLEPGKDVVFDIVCGMEVPAKTVKFTSAHSGEAYHFCSQSCKSHFDGDPGKYAGQKVV